jgi:two-component system, OmpR family, response regulator
MKVLLVERQRKNGANRAQGLTEKGRMVDHAGNGRDGSCLAAAGRYDAIILRRALTGGTDGLHTMCSVGYRLSADA